MGQLRLSELAAAVGCEWEGDEDPLISGAASLLEAEAGDITFVADKKLLSHLSQTRAAAVVVHPDVDCPVPVLRTEDPYGVFARILSRFAMPREHIFPPGIHPTAVIDPSASLGKQVSLGPYVVVGAGARIGDGSALGSHVVVGPQVVIGQNCTLYPLSAVREGCILGSHVVLHAGAVIGTDGFGYLPDGDRLHKIPQIGIVELADHVEVGANSCIDRATTGCTFVGAGTKIDNLVQIGHNVTIGRSSAISAQTGVSGSCQLGDGVSCGGQVGIADHVKIADGVKIAAKTGVFKDAEPGQTLFWYPAFDMRESFKMVATLRRLPEMLERLRKLEKSLQEGKLRDKESSC
jgi:UDP-3-O-[3-hydroxymyristoyl] glucosamine N-acyltransferase